LKSKRHINLPGVKVNLPSFTEKDRADTTVGLEEGIDFVALSFVRESKDIDLLRAFLSEKKSRARIIAKIEDQSAIDHLDSIVASCDALMVARGDLGIECPFEELPVIQRRAVRACLAQGRPVIVATHMLESMISQPVPTRAEITDVANAVFELADCVMLSGETTIGKYPLECVQMLDKISRRIEAEETSGFREAAVFTGERMKVLHSAVVLANELPRSHLVTFTRHGFMAQGLAALRPAHATILAFTPSPEVFRQLRLLRSVEPFLMPLASEPDITIENAIALLVRLGRVVPGDKLIVATDIVAQDRLVDSVQLRTVR
jgi:pyruvate kinase